MTRVFVKDPSAKLDFSIDWSAWLGSDTIATAEWTVPDGITKSLESKTTTTTTIWLVGGTAHQQYAVTCRITTNGGRIDDRTIYVKVRNK
jgi:hypothetical protein